MIRTAVAVGTLAYALTGSTVDAGQAKTLPGDTVTVTATVEGIEQSTRTLTLRKDDGTYVTLSVPQSVKRFPQIKLGDTVTARYYDTITIRKKMPDEPDVNTDTLAVTPGAGSRPVGTAGTQRTMTATISAVDVPGQSVTFKGPNNWTYSSKVKDKEILSQIAAGDRVDIVWTEALTLSVKGK
jgi:hypothetical protein